MATPVDPAGAASQALYTPPVRIPTPTEPVNITSRPVEETNNAERPNDSARTQRPSPESNLGNFIDTMA